MLDVQVAQVKRPSRIAVDWDSTLVEEVWPVMGGWLPGAVDALKRLAGMYDEVVIFSLRVAPVDVDEVTPRSNWDQILAIESMLDEAGVPLNVRLWLKPYKPPTEFFIDDRNIEFNGDWNKALAQVGIRRARNARNITNREEETMQEWGMEEWGPAPVWIDQDNDPFACEGNCPCREDDQGAVNTPAEVIGQMERESWEEVRAEGVYMDELGVIEAARNQEARRDGAFVFVEPVKDELGVIASRAEPWTEAWERVRTFETGATRDVDVDKYDYEGFLSPWALEAFAAYMHKNRVQSDGTLRASDNWQKGIPLDAYMKSMWRHFIEVWQLHRGGRGGPAEMAEALSALLFNVQGYLHETVHP